MISSTSVSFILILRKEKVKVQTLQIFIDEMRRKLTLENLYIICSILLIIIVHIGETKEDFQFKYSTEITEENFYDIIKQGDSYIIL